MEKQNELVSLVKNNGYVFFDGKLQQCKYICTKYHFIKLEEEANQRYYAHYHIVELPNGDFYNPEDNNLYDSVADYEANKTAQTSTRDARKAIGQICQKAGLYKRVSGPDCIEFYTFENGEPVEHRHELTTFSLEYGDGVETYEKWALLDDSIFPTDTPIYHDRDEAFQFNTYTVNNADGTTEQRDGVSKLLMLDQDQRELLQQFEEAAKKLSDAGVMLVGNFCEDYSAYNTRHVADIKLMDSYSSADAKNWEQGERCHKAFDVHLNLEIWSEDCDIFIKRKTNKEEQK